MRVLMIGAHQDDNEFRSGGSAHRLVKVGVWCGFFPDAMAAEAIIL